MLEELGHVSRLATKAMDGWGFRTYVQRKPFIRSLSEFSLGVLEKAFEKFFQNKNWRSYGANYFLAICRGVKEELQQKVKPVAFKRQASRVETVAEREARMIRQGNASLEASWEKMEERYGK